MATSLSMLLLLLLSFALFSPSLSDILPSVPVPPSTACNSTPDPTFCKSVLPPSGHQDLYSYGRFSLAKSLSNARSFLAMINRYLANHSGLTVTAIRALQDCQLLAGLNIDFLSAAGSAISSATTLLDPQADRLQTLLSALLTNQQTCADGIQAAAAAWSLKNGLSVPISNSTKLYTVSLALFNRAWAPVKTKKRASPRIPRRLLQSSDAVQVSDVVTVSQDGTGNFTTISDAVAAAPNNTDGSDGYFMIYVAAGVYEEYVVVAKNKKYIMMIGDGANSTVITGNHSNVDGWTTFNSATLAVVGQGFVGVNMTIRNTAGAVKHQAVALRNGADLSAFHGCNFEGYQDTLYAHSMRQFYGGCDVYGTVDYIFGNAAVVLQGCNIYSRLPMRGQSNTVTAQGRTDPNQNTGISIQGCTIAAAADLAGDGGATRTYLGRPWKNYSRTVIMESGMDGFVDPTGWMPWDGDFALATLYYAEYNNTGPGADTSQRVNWTGLHVIDSTDAVNFTVGSFVFGDNWLPQTGVPYSSGFV